MQKKVFYMNLEFGPEYEDFRAEVIDFCKEYEGISFENTSSKNVSRSEWQKILIEKGFIARAIPKEYGGFGGETDIIKSRIIATEFSKAKIPGGMGGQGIDMLVPTLLEWGTEEQKQQYIQPTLHGEMIWCQGYSEPMMFCLVRTEPQAPKHSGISFILIPMDTPGIEIRPLVDITLNAGFNEVFFTDVTVPEGNIVGKRGDGWSVANSVLGHERGSLADPNATMNSLNTLINMMKEETIDEKRLIDIPSYRDRLMQVQGKVMANQAHSLRLLSSKINPGQNVKLGGMIQKLVGTELRHEMEALAIDVLGEIGTLYEETPRLKENGSFQFHYMYFLGLIIGGYRKILFLKEGLECLKNLKYKRLHNVFRTI